MKTIRLIILLAVLPLSGVGCLSNITPDRVWTVDEGFISASLFHDGKSLAVISNGRVRIIPLYGTGNDVRELDRTFTDGDRVLCDDDTCWVGGGVLAHGMLVSYDLSDGVAQTMHHDKLTEVYDIALSHNKQLLATVDIEPIVWDAVSGKPLMRLSGHNTEVFAVEFSSDDRFLYSGDDQGVVIKWDLSTGENVASCNLRELAGVHSASDIKYDVTTDNVICAGYPAEIVMLDTNLSLVRTIKVADKEAITSFDIRSSDGEMVCGLTDGYVAVLNADGTDIKLHRLHHDHVDFVSFINDGKRIVTVGRDGDVKLWDTDALISEP